MGRSRRNIPAKLAGKLLFIRQDLQLSQAQMVEELISDDIPVYKADISKYESGQREPPLLILLRYARLGKITMEMLVDDEIDLTASKP